MEKQIRELPFDKIVVAIQHNKIGGKFLFRVGTVSYYINCTATMKIVAKNPECAICGARATHAILCKNEDNYYVSFYTERNGKLILFTKDHIIPRANGGSNKVSNLQTPITISGTGLLIVVGVALETYKQIESQLVSRSYNKGRKGRRR